MTEQQRRKHHIRAFMRAHYTDERLAQLLAHAQDGKLEYQSCCCFIGIPTSDHALEGTGRITSAHYGDAKRGLPGAMLAEDAFNYLGFESFGEHATWGETRRRILIPIIRAEMRRRERLKKSEVIADAIIEEALKA